VRLRGLMRSSSTRDQAHNGVAIPRILLVEDEFLIRTLMAEYLRQDGFEVVEAANGLEAVELLSAGARIDLVLTDVSMPGPVDGLNVLQFVKSALPGTPVLVTSGHLEAAQAYAGGATGFLPKPLDLGAVVAALRLALETSG
jgi:CheY-like chemotaxis protein